MKNFFCKFQKWINLLFFVFILFCCFHLANNEQTKQILNLNGRTTLRCNSSKIKNWIFNNAKLESNKIFKIDNTKGELVISKSDISHEGVYQCVNKDGRPIRNFFVGASPRIKLVEVKNCKLDLKSLHVYSGKTMRIDCKSSDPKINYDLKWIKENKILFSKNNTNKLSLILNNVTDKDRADYVCRATNQMASYETQIYLRVRNSYAYILPITGIIAEIVILISIIWWSETHTPQVVVDD